eukprot:TRINITY_DN3000_c0_g3_i1.p1 TRINITY_DN3000_c0_g3~~TRINITY_DN3000_c0_g3_i1.p1  ORF type:complete len:331 (+),score=103.26 TRINITY_DN3000_c0_g3_i1:29-1021(+)
MQPQVFLRTEKFAYYGGETISGQVWLSTAIPIPCRGITVEIIGTEETWFKTTRRERIHNPDPNAPPQYRTIEETHEGKREIVNQQIPVTTFSGALNPGQYNFPIQYTLPAHMPGSFKVEDMTRANSPYRAEIRYILKVVFDTDMAIGESLFDVILEQELTIYPRMLQQITSKHQQIHEDITFCCCVNKGSVDLECFYGKDKFTPGETAQIEVRAFNNSSVDIDSFNSELHRTITLKASDGKQHNVHDTVARQTYRGIPAGYQDQMRVDLPIPPAIPQSIDSQGAIGSLISCKYNCAIHLDIPWCPDVVISLPTYIYLPQPQSWNQWQNPW